MELAALIIMTALLVMLILDEPFLNSLVIVIGGLMPIVFICTFAALFWSALS